MCWHKDCTNIHFSFFNVSLFNKAISKVADMLGISESSGGGGYRLIANAGKDAHQEVPHLHFHLLAGRPLGPMVFPEK